MDNTKKSTCRGSHRKEIPRAAYEGVLTIDVDAQVESMEEQEDARWHQLLNAHRTRKVLTGQLGGIEKLESGWMVAVTYYNGFRIIIPMNEMMINLSGDGRENADTLNRQVRIANNMLGCDIDFIIKDLDAKSRSVVASRKDAMLRKRQTFYFGETGEKPLFVSGQDRGGKSHCGCTKGSPPGSVWRGSFRPRKGYGLGMDGGCRRKIPGGRSGPCYGKQGGSGFGRPDSRGSGCQKPDGQYQQGQFAEMPPSGQVYRYHYRSL